MANQFIWWEATLPTATWLVWRANSGGQSTFCKAAATAAKSRKARHALMLLAMSIAIWGSCADRTATAGEIGHYAPGLISIRDYIMPADPGFYSSIYNYYYHSDRLNDADGNKKDGIQLAPGAPKTHVDVDADVFVTVPSLLWVSPWTILGARYGAYIAPSFANSSAGAALDSIRGDGHNPSVSSYGLGDLYVQPLWLDWSRQHWDFALGYGFYAPTGKYDVESKFIPGAGRQRVEATDNIGLGYWTHQFQAAFAYYPFDNKGTSITTAVTYELNQGKDGFDYTPGSRISVNWGISQYLPISADNKLLLELGPTGYSQWQVSDDTGHDVTSNARDQVHAVGAQLGLTVAPWNAAVNLHYFHELMSQDRLLGDVFGLNVAFKW